MVTTKLNLSMTEPSVRQIYAKQGDTGRVLDISLDQTPEDGTLRILRPDGVEVTSEAVTGGEVESGGTFESLAEADVTELTVGIEPVQDLNGYDKPWVGGAGKNLLNITTTTQTVSGVTFTVNSDGTIKANGTATARIALALATNASETPILNKSVIMNGCPSGGSTNTYFIQWYGYGGASAVANDTGNGTSAFTPTSTAGVIAIVIQSGVAVNNLIFKPMIRLATETDSTFAPYSNICPITGHDEVRVYDDPVYGKTIKWNQLIKNGNFADTSNWDTRGTITVSGNVATVTTPVQWMHLSQVFDWTYGHIMLARASVKKFGESGSIYVKVVNDFAYSNQQFAKGIATNDVWTDVVFCGTYTKTPSDSTAQVRFGVQEYRPPNSNNGFQIKNVGVFDLTEMFGEGNEPTIEEFEALFPKDYYPYNTGEETTVSAVDGDPNRQYTTSLGQTVYGGTLDMVTGQLVVNYKKIDLGNYDYGKTSDNNFYISTVTDFKVYGTGTTRYGLALCDSFAFLTGNWKPHNSTCTCYYNADYNGYRIFFHSEEHANDSTAEFKAYMQSIGASFVYELATPLTYTLTPQQIKTLIGTNNVWASSGDIVSIKFTYGGLLSELPSDATSIVGKCYCDIEQNGVSSMPFTLNVKKNERQ